MRACTGPCNQGRITCPTPDACEHSEEIDGIGIVRSVIYGLVAWFIVALVAAVVIGVK